MKSCDNKDIIRPIQPMPDGRTLVERHRPGHTTELAYVEPPQDGKVLAPGEEIATTRARGDGTHEIVDSYVRPGGKPAQVATEEYRNGWQRTFSSRGGSA